MAQDILSLVFKADTKELQEADTKLKQLKVSYSGLGSSLPGVGSAVSNMNSKVGDAATTFGGLSKLLGGPVVAGLAAVTVGFIALGAASLDAAAQVEVFKANLVTMTGSTEEADKAYRGLVEFAAKTPFDLKQAVEGYTKLRALGLDTSEAIMTSYGNTAAATGNSMQQMIEAVADASTGQFERLLEFGIKASKQGDEVAFTFQGVTTKVKNNSEEIQKYLIGIGQNQFGSAMANQMQGLTAAFAGFGDTVFQFMAAMGDGVFGATIADMINTVSSGIEAITPLFSGIMDLVGGLLSAVWEIAKGLGNAFTYGEEGSSRFKEGLDTLGIVFAWLGEMVSALGTIIGEVFSFIGNITGTIVAFIQDSFAGLFEWLFGGFKGTGQTFGQTMAGIVRAAGVAAQQISVVFKALLEDLKNSFSSVGTAIAAAFQGDFSKFGNIGISFANTSAAAANAWKQISTTFNDVKANQGWLDAKRMTGDGSLDSKGTRPTPSSSAGKGKTGSGSKEKEEDPNKAIEQYIDSLTKQTQAQQNLNQVQKTELELKDDKYKKASAENLATARSLALKIDEANATKILTEATEKFNETADDYVQKIKDEIEFAGMSKRQQEEIVETRKLDKEFLEQMNKLREEGLWTIERQIEAETRLAEAKKKVADATKLATDRDKDWAANGMGDYLKSIGTLEDAMQNFTSKALKGMEDGLVNLFMTGKFGFKEFANMIISELIRMMVQYLIMIPLVQAFKSLVGGFSSGGVIGDSSSSYASGGVIGDNFAAGGVMRPGPQRFFANGGMALANEAGPEAIMPLKRNAAGELGVVAQSTGGGQTIVENNMSVSIGSVDSNERQAALLRELQKMVESTVNKNISDKITRPGGDFYRGR